MIKIFLELPEDMFEVEELFDLTFGPGRNTLGSYRFRDGVSPISELCFVMRDEFNVLVGAIRFWPILVGIKRSPGLLLGPLGVHPTKQGEGLGEILIRTSLKKARSLGWLWVILVGDIDYYKRFSFSKDLIDSLYYFDSSLNHRLLGYELVEGSMSNLAGSLIKFSG